MEMETVSYLTLNGHTRIIEDEESRKNIASLQKQMSDYKDEVSSYNQETEGRIDSLDSRIDNINNDIVHNETNRLNDNSALERRIDQETTDRQNADLKLQKDIDKLNSAWGILSDSLEDLNLDNVSSDIGSASEQIGEITNNISKINTRLNNIDNEQTGSIASLSRRITNEVSTRENADNSLSNRITGEASARESADDGLSNRITTLEGYFPDKILDSDKIGDYSITLDKLTSNTQLQILNTPDYLYFKNHPCVIIGDSFSYGTGASDHNNGDKKRWSTLFCNKLEAIEKNFAVGSTGFCDPGSSNQNSPFKTQVDKAAVAMSLSERNDTHLVVIAGGLNDYNENATYTFTNMSTECSNAVQKARSNFPNALILVVPMLFKGHDANPRLINFESAIINGVNERRAVYIQGAWTWNFGVAANYIDDSIPHPSDLGHATIANFIYRNVFGGTAYENSLQIPTWQSGYSSSVANGGYFEFLNGCIYSYGMIINMTGSLAANSLTQIGSLSPRAGAAVPLVNICAPIMTGNAQAGIMIITSSGNIYIRNTVALSTDFFVAPFSYLPKGALFK